MSTGSLIHQMLLLNIEVLYFLTPSNINQIPVDYSSYNIDIYGADIEVNCVSTTTGTLVRSSLYSKFTLESLVLHNISIRYRIFASLLKPSLRLCFSQNQERYNIFSLLLE